MRELTKEEIKLAPSWATHYEIIGDVLTFVSEFHYEHYVDGVGQGVRAHRHGIDEDSFLIPRKSFDISEHEFNDIDILRVNLFGDKVSIVMDADAVVSAELSKKDIIAIAKALGVTGEDLK